MAGAVAPSFGFLAGGSSSFHAEKRFMARWILRVVVFGLVRTRLLIAIGCAVADLVVLKDGKLKSSKNLKWMVLSFISFLASATLWSLGRIYEGIDEDRAYLFRTCLRLTANWVRVLWAIVLGMFLVSAYLLSPKDQAALRAAVDKGKGAAEGAADAGKKAAGKGVGKLARRLDDFAKKTE